MTQTESDSIPTQRFVLQAKISAKSKPYSKILWHTIEKVQLEKKYEERGQKSQDIVPFNVLPAGCQDSNPVCYRLPMTGGPITEAMPWKRRRRPNALVSLWVTNNIMLNPIVSCLYMFGTKAEDTPNPHGLLRSVYKYTHIWISESTGQNWSTAIHPGLNHRLMCGLEEL